MRVPKAEITCQNLRDPFPPVGPDVGAVIASLSLHYFPWSETEALVGRIHGALRPGGLFLCRLNSTRDHSHGASGHPELEPNYFLVNGQPKRFFDRAAIERLFADGWRILSIEELVTHKYVRQKVLWELALERNG